MQNRNLWMHSLMLLPFVIGLSICVPADSRAMCQQPADQDEQQIQFNAFYKVEWRAIIEYYAEQAGLSLRIVDLPPTGTFDYQSDRSMTLREGLDFLNQMLIQSDRVLIRNGDLLSLYDVTKGIPDDLIDTIAADQLDQRGMYEVLNCNFDITGLQGEELRSQLEPYVSQHYRNNLTVIPAANVMIVQEIGYKLRFIRDQILAPAIKSRGRNDWDVRQIVLEHVSVEDVLAHAAAIGVRRDTMSNEDGSLTISASPFEDRILVTGNPDQINRFVRIVEAVDVPMGDANMAPREAPFFQRYTVIGEAEKIHQILQTLLAGSPEVRLDYDEDSNQIYLYGRKEDHDKAQEVINITEGSSDELSVLWIKNSDVEDIISTVETLFRQTDPENTDGPVLSAESQNRLIVRGKPKDVAMVRKMVEEIDIPFTSTASQETSRFISMDGSELGRTLNLLENMLPTLDLPNSVEVIQPNERNLFYNPERRLFEIKGAKTQPAARDEDPRRPPTDPRPETNPGDANDQSGIVRPSGIGLAGFMDSRWVLGGMITWQQQEETGNGSGQSSQESDRGRRISDDEQQPLRPNVPGAPIRIRVTEYGIGLESDDYEALDQIESLIVRTLDAGPGSERIAFFLLKYLDANEAKTQLESYLGISSGSGGGGGVLGGLMGGILSNALGGGAGEMASDLLGGGSSSSSGDGVFLTEGPVAIVANVNNYSLAVSASPNDMELISQLIDFMDQPEAMHDPNPVGETRTIPILYQDVFKVEEIVRKNLGEILKSTDQPGGGGNDPAQAQQQLIQAMLGRGRGGSGGGGSEEAEAPKASLSVDEKNSMLVVTGPKFAYDQILFLVRLVDVPKSGPPTDLQLVPRGNIEPRQLAEMLRLWDPDHIEIIENENATGSAAGTAGSTPGGDRTGSPAAPAGANPAINVDALQQLMRARNQGGGRGGRGGGRGGQGAGGGNIPSGFGNPPDGNRGGGGGNRGGG